jgi:probable DNA metabolism protein
MQVIYVCDGSFEGLLSAVHETWYNRGDHALNILPGLPVQPDFLITYKAVPTDPAKAERVFDAINGKISAEAASSVMMCWFSSQPHAGRSIINYLRLGFSVGAVVDEMVTHRAVLPVHEAATRVSHEAHKYTGLARFYRTTEDWYCSIIEPEGFILPMLGDHFARRMADSRFMIYDKRREISVAFDGKDTVLVPGRLVEAAEQCQDEAFYQQMWKRYFDTLAITGRLNPKLQRHMMPVRYWKHLVESPYGAMAKHLAR